MDQISRKREVPSHLNDNNNASVEIVESGDTVMKDEQTRHSNNSFFSASSLLLDDCFRSGMTYSYDQNRKWLFLGGGFDVAKAELSTNAKSKFFTSELVE